ncbi:MAG: hypothetical protein K2G09_00635 [Paramuribaculum sp.]|nr:hypothetical protein [Paramuribaculum sp.]
MKKSVILIIVIFFSSIISLNAKNPYENVLKEIMKEMVIKINDFNALPKDTPQYEIERQYKVLNQYIDNLVEYISELPKNAISKKDKDKYSDYFKSLRSRIAKYDVSENIERKEDASRDHQQSSVLAVKEVAVTNPTKENETSTTTKKNPNEEITLTVSSDGLTKDDAVKNALRLAIEQAYGAFVSANTTILNDEVVKDEIVTISNGAIKEYKIISEAQKPDGSGYIVTANATVSLPQLITYAKNHGSECEFAGNTFGMQMKLWEIEKENELRALENLKLQVETLLPQMINWEIEVGQPSIPHMDNRAFSNGEAFAKYTKFDVEFDVKECMPHPFDHYWGKYSQGLDSALCKRINSLNINDYYEVPITIYATTFPIPTDQLEKENQLKKYEVYYQNSGIRENRFSSEFGSFLTDNLDKIALTKAEASKMKDAGMELGRIFHPKAENDVNGGEDLQFRNRKSEEIITDIYKIIGDICCNFVMEDNMGDKHDFYFKEIRDLPFIGENQNVKALNIEPHVFKGDWLYVTSDVNSLSGVPFYIEGIGYDRYHLTNILEQRVIWEKTIFPGLFYSSSSLKLPLFKMNFYIPKSEIGKYSSFKVVKK